MTFRLKLVAWLAILLAPVAAYAQVPAPAPARDADPALWMVKDKDTTIYLFGTIHVLKPGLSWFDEAVKTAFDRSDTLVLEMVMPEPAAMQALVMKAGLTTAGPALTQRIPEKDRPAYVKALAEYGLPAAALDRAQPWLAATNLTMLPLQKLGYTATSGPETVLSAAAAAAHKPVIGLETAAQQIGYFAGLSDAAQVTFLTSTVRDLPKVATTLDEMVDEWARGDPDALARTMNEGLDDSPEVTRVLLTDRNARWADWIDARLKQPGTVFVAVGAGHLAGKDSVLAQLKKHHLKAKRIAY